MNDSSKVMLMDSYFDFMYAKAMHECLPTIVKENCYGCEVDHPSQLQHACLIYDHEESIYMYFDELLSAVNEDSILLSWSEIVDALEISPEVVALHKLKIYDKDWLATMKTEQWKAKMKKIVLSISHIEKRLFQ